MPRRDPFWLLAAVAMLLLAACGDSTDSGGDAPTSVPEVEPSSASSPFTVGEVPEGFEPVVAGRGAQQPSWGSDSAGTEEPFTVMSPDGSAEHPGVVVVSITGFEGQQGGLHQASKSYWSHEHEKFTIDGREAIYAPARQSSNGPVWADLVAVREDDLAVRVTSPDATRAELVALLDRVEVPSDRTQAPTVDPPDGLTVVGSVDSDAVVALLSHARRDGSAPGPGTAHAAGWRRPDAPEVELLVLTVPGRSVELDAVPGIRGTVPLEGGFDPELREVDGRRAILFPAHNSLWLESDWGDVIIVSARGATGIGEAELTAVARSVRPTDGAAWEEFIVAAFGGPGLHPDPGRVEITRGRTGDQEWLLQTAAEESWDVLDGCLKLSDRTRRCAAGTGNSADLGTHSGDDGLLIAQPQMQLDAATLRATLWNGDVSEAPLVQIPGTSQKVAVLFLGPWAGQVAICPDELGAPPVGEPGTMVLEALDADGKVLDCLSSI